MLSNSSDVSLATEATRHAAQKLTHVFAETTAIWFGSKYDEEAVASLRHLEELYKAHLQVECAPKEWRLTQERYPTHMNRGVDWCQHVLTKLSLQPVTSPLHFCVYQIVKQASFYLFQRENRYFGSGSGGDVTEQFFSELIAFALHECQAYPLSDAGAHKLEQRIHYIRAVRDSSRIFKLGLTSSSQNNHRTAITGILSCLETALHFVKREAPRQGALALLVDMKQNCAALCQDLSHWLYYLSAFPVQASCFYGDYIGARPHPLDEKLLSTHLGQLLKAFILGTGSQLFGVAASFEQHSVVDEYLTSVIHDPRFWEKRASGLPVYVTASKRETYDWLTQLQMLCIHASKLGELYRLLELAVRATQGKGEDWACGKAIGRTALEAVVSSLRYQLTLVQDLFHELQTKADSAGNHYINTHTVKNTALLFTHYRECNAVAALSMTHHQRLEQASHQLIARIRFYSKVGKQQTLLAEYHFYQGILDFIKSEHPDWLEHYQTLAVHANRLREKVTHLKTKSIDIIEETQEMMLPEKQETVAINSETITVDSVEKALLYLKTTLKSKSLDAFEINNFYSQLSLLQTKGNETQKKTFQSHCESLGYESFSFGELLFVEKQPAWFYRGTNTRRTCYVLLYHSCLNVPLSLEPALSSSALQRLEDLVSLNLKTIKQQRERLWWPFHRQAIAVIKAAEKLLLAQQARLFNQKKTTALSNAGVEPPNGQGLVKEDPLASVNADQSVGSANSVDPKHVLSTSAEVMSTTAVLMREYPQATPVAQAIIVREPEVVVYEWIRALGLMREQHYSHLPLQLNINELERIANHRVAPKTSLGIKIACLVKRLMHDATRSLSTLFQAQIVLMRQALEEAMGKSFDETLARHWLRVKPMLDSSEPLFQRSGDLTPIQALIPIRARQQSRQVSETTLLKSSLLESPHYGAC